MEPSVLGSAAVFNTIQLIFPSPTILGYNVCVAPIIKSCGPITVP